MINFVLIGICIIAGMLFRRSGALPNDAHKGINGWILYVALPAVCFKYIPHIKWNKELIFPAVGPIIVWAGGWLAATVYAATQKADRFTKAGLKLTIGLSNTSFIGFPLIIAYFNEQAINTAIICDQVTFMLLSTVGIVTAMRATGKDVVTPKILVKRLFKFPPFLACILALIIPHFADLHFAEPLFDKLAGTVGPLALFSIGLQLKFKGIRKQMKALSLGVFYKLLIAPLLVLVLALIVGFKGQSAHITIFEAAMPTLLTAGVVADEYELNPGMSNLVIGITIILSFITTVFWYFIIQRFI